MEELKCLRCCAMMQLLKRETLQLGQTTWLFGDLPNLMAGGLDVEIYACPQCGKLEFFQQPIPEEQGGQTMRICPRCGRRHGADRDRCPACGYFYFNDPC